MAIKIDKFQSEKPQNVDIVKAKEGEMPFSRLNFWMMGGCIALIILGFILMSGGGSSVEEGFNPEIFSTRRIIVGPLLSFLGFVLMAFAIIYLPKRKNEISTSREEKN